MDGGGEDVAESGSRAEQSGAAEGTQRKWASERERSIMLGNGEWRRRADWEMPTATTRE